MATLAQDKTLRDHLKDREGFTGTADKPDVDEKYYYGYGSHFRADGGQVQKGDVITEEDADALLTRDIKEREAWLGKTIPRYDEIPDAGKRALIDVAFGVRDVLTERRSPLLHEALKAAKNEQELLDAVKAEYPSYRKAGGRIMRGLETRRRLGHKNFFGEDYEYPEYKALLDAGTHMRVGEDIRSIGEFAKLAGVSVERLKELNPKLTDTTLRAGDLYRVKADAEVRQDAKGGGVSGSKTRGPDPQPAPEPSAPARIVINPKVFKDKRDGLCTAYNEAFRVLMEVNGFDPQAEPTGEQRKFFSDTAYAGDELMLRRTILARICTFDTSVEDPTDEQLDEAVEFLDAVMEMGAPQTGEEQANVQRIRDIIAKVRQSPRPEKKNGPAPGKSQGEPGGGAKEPSSEQAGGGAPPGQAPLGAQPE